MPKIFIQDKLLVFQEETLILKENLMKIFLADFFQLDLLFLTNELFFKLNTKN